jgi:flagellar motor switch protein FliN
VLQQDLERVFMASEHAMNMLTAAERALAALALPPAASQLPQGARSVQWEELDGSPARTQTRISTALGNEMLDLQIELGRTRIDRDEVQKLRTGSVLPLDNAVGSPVDLYAGGRLIARGEVLAIDGKFAVRVLELHHQYA